MTRRKAAAISAPVTQCPWKWKRANGSSRSSRSSSRAAAEIVAGADDQTAPAADGEGFEFALHRHPDGAFAGRRVLRRVLADQRANRRVRLLFERLAEGLGDYIAGRPIWPPS